MRRLSRIAAGALVAMSLGIGASDALGAGSARITGVGALTEAGNSASATAASGAVEKRRERVAGLEDRLGKVGEVVVRLEADAEDDSARATGTVVAKDVLLLEGRIAIARLEMSVEAPGADGAPPTITAARVEGLYVDGEPLDAGPGTRIRLEGLGTLVLFESVTEASEAIRANALRIEATEGTGGAAAASPFVIGHLSATAVADAGTLPQEPAARPEPQPEPANPAPAPAPTAPPATPREPTPSPFDVPGLRPAPAPTQTPATPRVAPNPSPVAPPSSGQQSGDPSVGGSVFPVLGDVSFTNDWGAPRPVTGTHKGNDLFAETGTPLVAVADGTLFQVGVNTLGGNRLWLRDNSGTEYYYAHLSAFAPGSVNGAQVRAGEVIGFMGNSGQAITTPPHLHFQVHPGGGDAINPYPYLVAWQQGSARSVVAVDATQEVAPLEEGPAPATGAVIVSVEPAREEPAPVPGGRATPAR